MSKLTYILAGAAAFGAGAYAWKLVGSRPVEIRPEAQPDAGEPLSAHDVKGTILVDIGGESITVDDVKWEYDAVTAETADREALTPIPDLGARYAMELQPLQRAIFGTLIERKLLMAFIRQDRQFNVEDPARFVACLEQWQQYVRDGVRAVQVEGGKDRLKSRLCERDLVLQYLKERVFAAIKVTDAEVVEYFKNHVNEFNVPDQVEIRQILLPTEAEAKKVRARVDVANFAELAKAHSIAPESERGGHLGPFSMGTMPSVFEVASHLRKGQISEIMKSPYGYHIILLLEKLPKRTIGLDEARPQILGSLRKTKEEEEYRRLVERALSSVTVSAPKGA